MTSEEAPEGLAALRPMAGGALLTDRVEEKLRSSILSGKLPPGTHLSVPELARRLEISRTPAREALFRLEREGLVQMTPRRGAIVPLGTRADLEDLFEIREALEGYTARLAAGRRSEAELDELREILDRHRDAVDDQDLDSHLEADVAFHGLLREAGGNAHLESALGQLQGRIELVMRAGAARPGGIAPGVLPEHQAIFDAVERADPDTAERAARAHVRSVRHFLTSLLFPMAVESEEIADLGR